MELALSISLGIGLSAACGFRIFVPLLAMSFAANAGHINLSDGFDWIATWPAFACFLTATILEIRLTTSPGSTTSSTPSPHPPPSSPELSSRLP